MIYADSSALVPLYVPERHSPAARSVVRRAGRVPFTILHQLEISNAFEMLVGRRLISRAECSAVQAQLQDDLESGRLVFTSLDMDRVFADACELSHRHTTKLLARSLDLLHVASAHLSRCEAFVSADDRQLAVARASGLSVVDIKRRRRRNG